MDPLVFNGGVQFLWRNGDVLDIRGQKCNVLDPKNGVIVGKPTVGKVISYAWYYLW